MKVNSIRQKLKKRIFTRYFKFLIFSFIISEFSNGYANDTIEEQSNQSNLEHKFYWPQNHFDWYYSALNEPSWLSHEESLKLFMNASKAWFSCGPEINFKGVINIPPRQKDGVNVLGWYVLPASLRGITLRQTNKITEEIVEADVIINASNQDLKNDPRLLQKVVSHEFGHALGLIHSDGCSDVMSNASECGAKIKNPPPIEITEKDLAQCKIRYLHSVK